MRRVIKKTAMRAGMNEKYLIEAERDSVDIELIINHVEHHTKSHISICIVARDGACVDVVATAQVDKSADSCEAWLEIQVVATGGAVVRAAPNLEINNKHSKAGHSLKTKHITESELFYLMSRGISRAVAEELAIESMIARFRDNDTIELV